MAFPVVEKTKQIIYDHGPNIIRSDYWETGMNPVTEKPVGWLGRLQAAPGVNKTNPTDPHIGGRALDIILRNSITSELNVANELVGVFLGLRTKMKWIAVIYNKWEWNSMGTKFPRGGDAINQHLTHIHIEWRAADGSLTGFEPDLESALKGMAPSDTDYEF